MTLTHSQVVDQTLEALSWYLQFSDGLFEDPDVTFRVLEARNDTALVVVQATDGALTVGRIVGRYSWQDAERIGAAWEHVFDLIHEPESREALDGHVKVLDAYKHALAGAACALGRCGGEQCRPRAVHVLIEEPFQIVCQDADGDVEEVSVKPRGAEIVVN